MSIEKAAYAFRMNGTPVSCKHIGNGHINTTQKIVTDQGAEYVLQRINTHVFKDPVSLMNNAGTITDFIRGKVDDPRLALHFITTKDGKFYHLDEDGSFWRMYDFVGGFCLDAPESEEDFYQSALAFGRFQQLLSDFPAESLVETIPEFHNTVDRYRQFKEAVAADPMGRLDGVREEVEFLLEREEIARASIDNNGKIIVTATIDEAIEIANGIAPEHLELCLDKPFDYLDKIRHAGSVFLGKYCPEAIGDYYAGTNHTLPTSGTARFSSPLSVDDFIKKTQYIYYEKDSLRQVAQEVEYFAKQEGLTAHARSAVIRFEDEKDE